MLKRNASPQSSSDFVKEVENMVELASKPQCKYIIKLRGVCKGIKVLLLNFLFLEINFLVDFGHNCYSRFCDRSIHWWGVYDENSPWCRNVFSPIFSNKRTSDFHCDVIFPNLLT